MESANSISIDLFSEFQSEADPWDTEKLFLTEINLTISQLAKNSKNINNHKMDKF